MKRIQKITRVKLKTEQEEELILIGLVSAEPDYKLSLTLNRSFGISLKNNTPVKINDLTGTELSFSRFSDTSGSPHLHFNLFSNRSGKYFLLKTLKNVDYIFQVYDSENHNSAEYLLAELRRIETITAIFNIDITTFKDKNLPYLIQ